MRCLTHCLRARGLPVVALACAVVVALAACSAPPRSSAEDPAPTASEQVGQTGTVEAPESLPADGDVLMMGRSVMRGWFDHWGAGGATNASLGDHGFTYLEVPGPPEIGSAGAAAVERLPEGSVVFFKLCFVDFQAWSDADAQTCARTNLGYIETVHEACADRGLTLIVGNALPQVAGATTPALVKAHRAYNEGLERLEAESDDLLVLDMYGVLADESGALKPSYAASAEDSHLSEAAYDALDDRYLEILERVR